MIEELKDIHHRLFQLYDKESHPVLKAELYQAMIVIYNYYHHLKNVQSRTD